MGGFLHKKKVYLVDDLLQEWRKGIKVRENNILSF